MNQENNIKTHPSYGMIELNHCSSTGSYLVGSEFKHHHFLTLSIKRAQVERSLSRERLHGKEELIEVHLSEAQYVELMERINMGDGVTCTIAHVAGQQMPEPPPPVSSAEKHRADMKADTQKFTERLEAAHKHFMEAIDSGHTSKTVLREIAAEFWSAGQAVSDGIPFVQESFDESMEKTINHAKAEIEGTIANLAMRLGVQEIQRLNISNEKMLGSGALDMPALDKWQLKSPTVTTVSLSKQTYTVFRYMCGNGSYAPVPHTLRDIRTFTGVPEASVSAQLRNLRKVRCGSHTVTRRTIDGQTWYTLKPNPNVTVVMA